MDDSADLFELAEACESHFEFVWATDGLTALERVGVFEPDAILLATDLLQMDGYEVVRALRRDPRFRDTPIALYSREDGPDERRTARDCGATELLKRPLPAGRVIDALERQVQALGVQPRPKSKTIDSILDIIEFGTAATADDKI